MSKLSYPQFNNRAICMWLDDEQMRQLIKVRRQQYGSQRTYASHLGICTTYLSELEKGSKAVSHTVARKVGYRKVTVYVPEDQ